MDFSLTDEQRMLQDTVERLVREHHGFEQRETRMRPGESFSRDLWRRYAELGLLGVSLSEDSGGFGGGVELMLVMQAFGRGLVPEPYLASVVLAGGAVDTLGSRVQKAAELEPMIVGSRLLAFAHGEPRSRYDLARVETRAEAHSDGYRLSGRKAVVLHGDAADRLVVSARVHGASDDRDGIGLFLVDAGAEGVERRGYPTIDGLRAAEIVLGNVAVPRNDCLGTPGEAYAAIEATVARGVVALCAEAVGAMEAACDLTLDYLKTRTQFGVPIGRFQALQHRMVDMRIGLEQARSMAILAASRLDRPAAVREPALSAAKNLIGRSGRFIAEQSIQLHGGIGMTWEYALGHYAKRLVMIDHVLGDADHHLERYAALSGGAAPTETNQEITS